MLRADLDLETRLKIIGQACLRHRFVNHMSQTRMASLVDSYAGMISNIELFKDPRTPRVVEAVERLCADEISRVLEDWPSARSAPIRQVI